MDGMEYCDDCGEELGIPDSQGFLITRFVVEKLPTNIDSANVGESAILCKKCYESIFGEIEHND